MQSSDSSSPSVAATVVPCVRPTTRRAFVLSPTPGTPTSLSESGGVGSRVPGCSPGACEWRYEVSQVTGSSLSEHAAVTTPPVARALAHFHDLELLPSSFCKLWASKYISSLSGLNSRGLLARLPTHRPIHHCSGARLAAGLPGSALARRDFHPLDDLQDFRSSACSFPS
jgi:hypothetical protein